MSWRTVIISRRCKLDYRMNYLVIRSAAQTQRVFIDEIALLLVENTAVSFTGCLLEELTTRKVKVIFCDTKHNPLSELVPLHGSHDSSLSIKKQMNWTDEAKQLVWQRIVREKLARQAKLLGEQGRCDQRDMLYGYIIDVLPGDTTNREGFGAKVYFNALFGMGFTREKATPINAALDYGYGIVLSAINREVSAEGYLAQIGVFHDNRFNHFNLSCDLMEPYRTLVDRAVIKLAPQKFESEERHSLWNILAETVLMDDNKQTALNSMRVYVRSCFNALEAGDPELIKFYTEL